MALGDLVDPPTYDNDEVFIRRFKDDATRIRFLPSTGKKLKGSKVVTVYGTEAWPSELQHFKREIPGGNFPCVAIHPELGLTCGGCEDPDPKVKKRSRQWYANALDDTGVVRIYQMGIKLKELLEAKESRHPSGAEAQPLSLRDVTVYHIGEGLESTYDPELEEPSKIDFTDVFGHDIAAVLMNRANMAQQFYYGEQDYDEADEPVLAPSQGGKPDPVVTRQGPRAGIQPKTAGIQPKTAGIQPKAAKKTAAAKEEYEEPPFEKAVDHSALDYGIDPDGSAWQTWGNSPTLEQIEAAETPVIRAWLDLQEVEYPSRAARVRLIDMANAKREELK